MTIPDSKLAATIFAIDPPVSFSNGRELLDALITDAARASGGSLSLFDDQRRRLILPSWGHQSFASCGLHRHLDLRFRVLWPRSGSPGLEVSGGNCFTFEGESSGSEPILISPAEIYERFPEASNWVRSVSDVSLIAHIHAVTIWYNAAESAGWKPQRLPLEEIPSEERYIISGQGRMRLEEPLKSIILTRTPVTKPGHIDLTLVGRANDARAVAAIETAFRKLWPGLAVSIRQVRIEQQPIIEPPRLSLLVIPDGEDIISAPWIGWLQACESKGALFRIVRQQTLRSSDALGNLVFDLFMLAGGVPWIVEVDPKDQTVFGLDAGHNRKERWSQWVSARLDVGSNTISCKALRTELAEHIPATAIRQLLPAGLGLETCTVLRDGRFLSENPRDISPQGMTVSVVKDPVAILYRQVDGHLLPAQFGDALRYPDGRVLLQTSTNRNTTSGWKMPIRLKAEKNDQIHRAVSLSLLLCRQPALGLFSQPRLPAPIYWADLISKTTATGWPKVVGRGLGLESIIP